jgi:hypothetical protein
MLFYYLSMAIYFFILLNINYDDNVIRLLTINKGANNGKNKRDKRS